MKRFGKLILAVVAVTFTLGLTITEAEAARFGGGKSFGAGRSNSAMRQAAPPAKPAQNATAASAPAAAAAPAAGMSRWMGPIAGLAAGIGLAAMLSHFGMGEGVANFMMIALLVMAAVFLVRFLMRKREPVQTMQYAAAGPSVGPSVAPSAHFEAVPGMSNGVSSSATARSASFARPPCSAVVSEEVVSPAPTGEAEQASSCIPADFDVAGFVRQAKLNFVRLQAANDRGDLDDIRQFTAPEVFAEIQMQLQERGSAPQQTDVVQLEAELLSVETEAARHLASVRFSGQLREDANGAPQAFAEVWHLSKPTDGSRGWQVAGILQLS